MTNWLADPVACAIRLKTERGCTILAGRNEVLSRSTVVHRTDLPKGSRYAWGHLYVETNGKPGQERTIRAGVNGSTNLATELPALAPEHANAMADLLRAAYVNAGGSSCGGKSMLELFWDELMVVYERLVTGAAAEDDVGLAQGIAYCIAVAQNPYLPNVDAVREQAAERWEQQEQEPPSRPAPPQSRRAARMARRRG